MRARGEGTARPDHVPPGVDVRQRVLQSIRPTYWGVFNSGLLGVLVQADLSYTVVLELGSTCSTSTRLGSTIEAELARFFEDLSPDTTVQVLHLSEGSDNRTFDMSPRRTVLSISVHSAPRRLRARIARRLARLARPDTLGITSHEHEVVVRRLHATVTRVLPAFYRAGVLAHPLRAPELRLLVGQLLPTPSNKIRPVGRQRMVSPGTLRCGDRLVRALSLTVLPPRSDAGLLDALLMRLPTAARVHVAFTLGEPDAPAASHTPTGPHLHVPVPCGHPYRFSAAPMSVVPFFPRLRSVVTVFLSVHAHQKDAEGLLDEQARQVVEVLGQEGADLVSDSDAVNLSQLLATLPGHGRRARRSLVATAEQAAQLVAVVQSAA